MNKHMYSGLLTSAAALVAMLASAITANADPGHKFAAGELGDPRKVSRIIEVVARESDGKMMFVPNKIEIRKGEQVRFVVRNAGELDHEFVLATREENRKHAAEMQKNPDMEHEDPNMKKIGTKKTSELVWRFTKLGTFEFGCLIPGHYESGMFGTIIVK
jgi:uncharacterized cupredoxin-like copper-binding protein|nr:cupredoxin family protein [Nitrosomonas nitrosa]